MHLSLRWSLGLLILCLFITTCSKEPASTAEVAKKTMPESERLFSRQFFTGEPAEPKIKEFLTLLKSAQTRIGEQQPRYLTGDIRREMEQARRTASNARSREVTFTQWGPLNTTGRTRSIVVDMRDSTLGTYLIGTVASGVWKTEDNGQNWRLVSEDVPYPYNSIIAASESDPTVIYMGTGEVYPFPGSIASDGLGLYKSTDGGENWEPLEGLNPDSLGSVMDIAVNPSDPDELYVISIRHDRFSVAFGLDRSLLWYSDNGGGTWTLLLESVEYLTDIAPHPDNFEEFILGEENVGILRTANRGQDLTPVFELPDSRRIVLKRAPSDPRIVHALEVAAVSEDGFGVERVRSYRSTDSGRTWSGVEPSTIDYSIIASGQGNFSVAMGVHSENPNLIYVGGTGGIVSAEVGDTEELDFDYTASSTFPFFREALPTDGQLVAFTPLLVEQLDLPSTPAIDPDTVGPIELVFGDGPQMVMRHTNDTPADFLGTYQDYVEVPFQAFIADSTQQLMASFLDENRNGQWDPEGVTLDGRTQIGETIIVHTIPYDASRPASAIVNGRVLDFSAYTIGLITNPDFSIPFERINDRLKIQPIFGQVLRSEETVLVDGYFQFGASHDFTIDGRNVHPDHHDFIILPKPDGNFKILGVNDGGFTKSEDGGQTWRSTGYNFDLFEPLTQDAGGPTLGGFTSGHFYKAVRAPHANQFIGGTQDNGSWMAFTPRSENSRFTKIGPGDGFEAIWNPGDSSRMGLSVQFGNYYFGEENGAVWYNSILPGAPFYSSLENPVQDPGLVYALTGTSVWATRDYGRTWVEHFVQDRFFLQNLEISLADPYVIWVSDRNAGAVFVSRNGGLSFEPVSPLGGNFPCLGQTKDVYSHPTAPGTAFLVSGAKGCPKILRTEDYGQNWTDITEFGEDGQSANGFPDVPVYSMIVMPHDTNWIWASTEIGLVESRNGGDSWALANNGFPAIRAWNMDHTDNQVVLATHGLGIWSATIPELGNFEYQLPEMLTPLLALDGEAANGELNGNVRVRSPLDSLRIRVIGQSDDFDAPFDQDLGSFIIERNIDVGNDIAFTVQLENLPTDRILRARVFCEGFRRGRRLRDEAFTWAYTLESEPLAGIEEDFEDGNPFKTFAFRVQRPTGFSNQGLHSDHPLFDSEPAIAIIGRPIVIAPDFTPFFFDEILIHPFTPDRQVTQEFVILRDQGFSKIEASADAGKSWESLASYFSDAAAGGNGNWTQAFFNGDPIEDNLYATRDINLNDFFEFGDTVYLRLNLRMTNANGGFGESRWGWAIDNMIFGLPTSTQEAAGHAVPTTVFPNPITDAFRVQFHSPKSDKATLQLFDIMGRHLADLDQQVANSGLNMFEANLGTRAAGTYLLCLRIGERMEWLTVVKK